MTSDPSPPFLEYLLASCQHEIFQAGSFVFSPAPAPDSTVSPQFPGSFLMENGT